MFRILAIMFAFSLTGNVSGQQVNQLHELRVISFEGKVYHVHVSPWHTWHEDKDGEIWYENHPIVGTCVRIGVWHAWLKCKHGILYKDACNLQHLDYLLTVPVIEPRVDIILQEYGSKNWPKEWEQ